MTQDERRRFLIGALLAEQPQYRDTALPEDKQAQRLLLRALLNVRPPLAARPDFLRVQDAYLQAVTEQKGVVDYRTLRPVRDRLYLWQGDITALKCDAIVNAANSALLGCFIPCHGCIDNAIHSAAGVQLRLECARLMNQQGTPEPTGQAKITKAYNLPCRYVLHTVGPIVRGAVTEEDRRLLSGCYLSCLELAESYGLKSVAFCCISTGEFHFPNEEAARIAIQTVEAYQKEHQNSPEVIFNVFKDNDLEIYRKLLG